MAWLPTQELYGKAREWLRRGEELLEMTNSMAPTWASLLTCKGLLSDLTEFIDSREVFLEQLTDPREFRRHFSDLLNTVMRIVGGRAPFFISEFIVYPLISPFLCISFCMLRKVPFIFIVEPFFSTRYVKPYVTCWYIRIETERSMDGQ
ncbi:unnamed protein product [Protopolystoma xenopodis]|uniref:Uncharacterized protein n=1 Tax=Protopolystoma xenopodis TaxID=117903 RepID=A0A3S4ZH01_9PLAT|nr:unnamed protein product [Protopolystoma xenopodis]